MIIREVSVSNTKVFSRQLTEPVKRRPETVKRNNDPKIHNKDDDEKARDEDKTRDEAAEEKRKRTRIMKI